LARIYVPTELHAGASIELSQVQAHFLGTVLRKQMGDQLRVFNGEDGEWLAEITDLSKRKARINILKQTRAAQTAPDIWLLFAPVKKSRNHFIIEKATELGVALIRPVITARTTSKIRMDKMTAHIIEAAEQTERLDLPQIDEPVKLADMLQSWDKTRTLIFADEAGDGEAAANALKGVKPPCAILVGPEGGFTQAEREIIREQPYTRAISLGPRILRADTAVAATLTLWQALSGDWV